MYVGALWLLTNTQWTGAISGGSSCRQIIKIRLKSALMASLSSGPLLSVKGSKDNGKGRFSWLKIIKTSQPLIAGVKRFIGMCCCMSSVSWRAPWHLPLRADFFPNRKHFHLVSIFQLLDSVAIIISFSCDQTRKQLLLTALKSPRRKVGTKKVSDF